MLVEHFVLIVLSFTWRLGVTNYLKISKTTSYISIISGGSSYTYYEA